jgi:hypothetical protein
MEYSNSLLKTIRDSVNPVIKFTDSIQEISKNPGVTLLALDVSEAFLQIFHHPAVLGGNWTNRSQRVVSILGFQSDAAPVQLIEKLIKESKRKTPSLEKFSECISDEPSLRNLKNFRTDFHYLNIIPLPHLLTKTFMSLKSTDPLSVASAFFHVMLDFDTNSNSGDNGDHDISTPTLEETNTPNSSQGTDDNGETTNNEVSTSPATLGVPTVNDASRPNKSQFLVDFYHMLQFCFLCYKGKIAPVLYTLDKSLEMTNWFNNIQTITFTSNKPSSKRSNYKNDNSESDKDTDNPAQKISRKDQYFIDTMLKLNESVDKNIIKSNLDKAEKEPGFTRLEYYKKNMILNASATPPFDDQATEPTEILLQFMTKKNQFKAKEMLFHRLSIDNTPFHPNTQSFLPMEWRFYVADSRLSIRCHYLFLPRIIDRKLHRTRKGSHVSFN